MEGSNVTPPAMDEPAQKLRKTGPSFRERLRSLRSTEMESELEKPEETVEKAMVAFSVEPLQVDVTPGARKVNTEEKLRHERQKVWEAEQAEKRLREVQLPQLSSFEDLAEDMTLHRSLRLTTVAASLQWLRRLPFALRRHGAPVAPEELPAVARAEVQEICQQSLPHLMTEPRRAVCWLSKIASFLTWYELEGPAPPPGQPTVLKEAFNEPEQKVREWDESYRSLWLLLRQGLLPSFCIESERFSVTVFGEGSDSWSGEALGTVKPSASEPMALIFPSTRELRTLLQENHAHFQVPLADPKSATSAPRLPGRGDASASVSESTLAELRELRRDGVKATSPSDVLLNDVSQTSALWFHGAWRVHALLDVLRHGLFAPPGHAAAPGTPAARLPRLVSPGSFVNASVKTAEVVKLTKLGNESIAEIRGCFFPQQLRRFLQLLPVSLAKFSCEFLEERRLGVNAFTKLKQHAIESVTCERVGNGPSCSWQFKIV